MIETAIVLPTFFMLLFGFFQIGIVLLTYGNCTYAARTAARWAALHSTASVAPCNTTCVSGIVTPLLYVPSGDITVTTTYGSTNVVGSTVTVLVKVVYTVKIPFYNGSQNFTVGSKVVRTITR
jgi:Flp pilus assembly protein TadG